MRMSNFDRWITTEPNFTLGAFEMVDAESMTDKNGLPTCVDELECKACAVWVGWSSEGGYQPFWTDEADTDYYCEDCKDELI